MIIQAISRITKISHVIWGSSSSIENLICHFWNHYCPKLQTYIVWMSTFEGTSLYGWTIVFEIVVRSVVILNALVITLVLHICHPLTAPSNLLAETEMMSFWPNGHKLEKVFFPEPKCELSLPFLFCCKWVLFRAPAAAVVLSVSISPFNCTSSLLSCHSPMRWKFSEKMRVLCTQLL